MRELPDEAALRNSILSAPDPEQEVDLSPAVVKLGGPTVYHLVHKFQDEGWLEYERNWFMVKLTKMGRLMREEA